MHRGVNRECRARVRNRRARNRRRGRDTRFRRSSDSRARYRRGTDGDRELHRRVNGHCRDSNRKVLPRKGLMSDWKRDRRGRRHLRSHRANYARHDAGWHCNGGCHRARADGHRNSDNRDRDRGRFRSHGTRNGDRRMHGRRLHGRTGRRDECRRGWHLRLNRQHHRPS